MHKRLSLVLLLEALAGCATSITSPSGGAGGGGAGPGGAGGVGGDGGIGGALGPCTSGADCASLSDVCNTGTCINGACEKVPANEAGSCDDGKSCTLADTCQSGTCTSGSLKFCPSNDNCHVGFCDAVTDACTEVPGNDGATCSDDDACTGAGTCSGGACSPGPPSDCSFLDGNCVVGLCDPQTGCYAAPSGDGSPCDDGLFCTIEDTCQGGSCAGVPNTCAAPGDVCLIGTCNEALNQCTAVPGNPGGACNDGNACTSGEACSGGTCVGGVPANQGGACDDGNACTSGDTCAGGVCSGAPVVACVNGDGCCPAGCDLAADDDCGGAVYLTSSNGSPGFYGYDVETNAWSILPSPPVVTYSQLTTDGQLVYLLGQDNTIYSFDPATAAWGVTQSGPGAQAAQPIGFFKWTPSGFYYLKDGDTQLYKSNGNAWQTYALPEAGSSAGSFDLGSSKLYIRGYGNEDVLVFSTLTNTVTQTWPVPTNVGENSRTGSYYAGFFYERDWSAAFTKVDVATGVATVTNVTPAEGHTSTDVDPQKGDLYVGPYEPTGTVFQVYNVPTGVLKSLAPVPVAVQNHSTIVFVK